MTPAEREAHRLFVDGEGNIRQSRDGSLFDTAGSTTHWSGGGRAIFVMDEHGNLFATPHQEVGVTHHSSLLAGGPVVGAGEIEVRNGVLVSMTDQSGHYRPTAEMNDRVLDSLHGQGLQTGPDFKRYGWNGVER
jgi:hypothetical protein